MARSRYRFAEQDRPHFLTATVVAWLPVFTRPEAAQVLFDVWAYQQAHAGLKLYGFVVLENHLHAVAQAPDLPRSWGGFKSYTARRLLDLLHVHGARRLLDHMAFAYKAGRDDTASVLAGGLASAGDRARGDAAAEAGVHAQQSGQARLRGQAGGLAVVECAELSGAGRGGGGIYRLVRLAPWRGAPYEA